MIQNIGILPKPPNRLIIHFRCTPVDLNAPCITQRRLQRTI